MHTPFIEDVGVLTLDLVPRPSVSFSAHVSALGTSWSAHAPAGDVSLSSDPVWLLLSLCEVGVETVDSFPSRRGRFDAKKPSGNQGFPRTRLRCWFMMTPTAMDTMTMRATTVTTTRVVEGVPPPDEPSGLSGPIGDEPG